MHDFSIKKTGLTRILDTTKNSCNGLVLAWKEPAFRIEFLASLVIVPAAFTLGNTWIETVVLIGACLVVLIVEILNTGLEVVVDRVGFEWNQLSKNSKDLGSAAVFVSLASCLALWVWALYRFFALQ